MAKQNILKERSFQIAIQVVNLSNKLKSDYSDYIISKQLCRSGTSIGALIRESEYSESRADFVHKLAIALKESNECLYWLEISKEIYKTISNQTSDLILRIIEIIKILTSSIITCKKHIKIAKMNN